MKPYTYLIGWSKHNLFYYGVRYAKKCSPDELWVKYKTSSAYVKDIYTQYGEPDIIQVRKVFTNAHEAMKWEHKVLRRLKVISKDFWINKTDNKAMDYITSKRSTLPGRLAALKVTTGKTYSDIHGDEKAAQLRAMRAESSKKIWLDDSLKKRMSKKPDDTSAYKRAADRRWADPEKKAAMSAKIKEVWRQRKLISAQYVPSLKGSLSLKSINASDSN